VMGYDTAPDVEERAADLAETGKPSRCLQKATSRRKNRLRGFGASGSAVI
jgi:hypothetical protein